MATIRQKRLSQNMALNLKEGRWKNLRDLLIASGYGLKSATQNTKAIIQSRGVQEQLVFIGFNENSAKAMVAEILLLGEESNRLRAADMVFKHLGSYAPEKKIVAGAGFVELIQKLHNYEDVN